MTSPCSEVERLLSLSPGRLPLIKTAASSQLDACSIRSQHAAALFPGQHAIFPELFQRALEILKSSGPNHWFPKTAWDPFLFIDWCDEAREKRGEAEIAAVEIHTAEWQLLFDWCVAKESSAHS